MQVKFDVFFTKNLGTLYKDNSVTVFGKEANVSIDLREVSDLSVNYKVGESYFTDLVDIVDVDKGVIRIPFKNEVLKVGVNKLEVVAVMKNGDVLPSQTFVYGVESSVGEGDYIGEGTSISGIRYHSHDNLGILNIITELKVNEWNDKAEKNHTHSEYLTQHQDISHLADKKDVYTKAETDNKILEEISKAQLEGEDVDLSAYALKTELPTKTSELTNDSGYLTSIPSEYITEMELDAKGYLTEHQDLSSYALKTELHNHNNKEVLDSITNSKIDEWNNKSDFDGNYNSLTNKPTIPSIEGLATETFVRNEISKAQLGGGDDEIDLSGYATKDDLNVKADRTELPTKVSQLINDSGYLTSIPSEYITDSELDAKGYLTEHQDISHLSTKSYVDNAIAEIELLEGPQGPQGLQGEKGDKGDVGPQGERGLQGEVGPQGEKGDKGDKGDPGEQGPQGPKGDTGPTGPQGLKGDDGYTPIKGVDYFDGEQGPKGDKGDTGEQGPEGPQGIQGEQGPKGEQGKDGYTPIKGIDYFDGAKGDKGDKGDIGPQGPKGDNGYTPIKGVDYFDGEQGPQGPQGPKGDKGEQGPQGPKGDTGPTGPQGLKGNDGYTPIKGVDYFDGEQGPKGDKGDTGEQGPKGDKGDTGEQGIQGIQGVQGVKGDKGDTGATGPQGPKGDTGPAGTTDYNNLLNKPTIPTKTSELTNDSNFVTTSTLDTRMNNKTIWCGTKSQYDAITSKNSNTLYFVMED